MQAVAYYVELLQYDIVDMTTVEPPFTLAQDEPGASTAAPPTAGTNTMPVSTTTTTTHRPATASTTTTTTTPTSTQSTSAMATTPPPPALPTVAHAPGYYAPIVAVPLPSPVTTDTVTTGTAAAAAAGAAGTVADDEQHTGADVAAPADANRPQMGTLPLLSISNQQFFNWFLQGKSEQLSQLAGRSPGVHHPLFILHTLPCTHCLTLPTNRCKSRTHGVSHWMEGEGRDSTNTIN